MKLTISPEIIQNFPEVTIGVVTAESINNRLDNPQIASELKRVEAAVRQRFQDAVLSEHPTIRAWRQAYKVFRAGDYRSSVENLTKRIAKGNSLPHINNLVDIYNIISLRHTLPVGGEDLDCVNGDIILTEAKGDEEFIPLLETESNPPTAGEIVYKDDATVLCRKWNWRESDKTKLTEDTRRAIFVIEGLLDEERVRIDQATKELADLLEKYCQCKTRTYILDSNLPLAELK